jgi:hypothetical protein
MKIRHGHDTIEGSDATAVVREMRAMATFTPTQNDREYMTQVSARAESQSGKEVRVDSAENFLADLKAADLIEVLEP